MDRAQVIRQLMNTMAQGDGSFAAEHLSPDFVLVGPAPEPLGFHQWLGLHQMLHAAMPDFSFNISDVQVKGDSATITMQITGTHEYTLDLSPMGLPVVPATGVRVRLPVERPRLTFEGDKIVSVEMKAPPGGGVIGLLEQLGVDLGG